MREMGKVCLGLITRPEWLYLSSSDWIRGKRVYLQNRSINTNNIILVRSAFSDVRRAHINRFPVNICKHFVLL